MVKKITTISVPIATGEKIRFFAKSQGKTIEQVIEETFTPLVNIGANYPENANVETEISPLHGEVTFRFSGKSTMLVGEFTEAQLEQMRKERFDDVKLSIAEVRNKDVKAK